jgi:ABC-2 type transport system permease protein
VVAHLLRLKLTLLRNGLRRSPWQVVGMAFGALYAVGLLLVAVGGLVALRFVDAADATVAVTLGGALLVLGWWVVPLVAAGVDSTLDPQRFATYAIPTRPLLTGLALAGLVGIPGVVTTLLASGTVVSWSRGPATVIAALVGAVLGVATCVVGARATTSTFAGVVGSRRFRDSAAVLIVVPLMLLGPILTALAGVLSSGLDALPGTARALSWTPLGAAWALPGAVAVGDWLGALGRLLVAAATVAVLVLLWSRALSRALVQPPASRGSTSRSRARGLGLFDRVPAGPTWAIAARCLVYWRRDPRYAGSLVVIPVLPLILGFAASEGSRGLMLVAAPVAAMLLGWSISADIAYDSTAFALHVSSAVTGSADRAGRALAAGILAAPVVVVLAVGSVWWTGRWGDLPAVLGAGLGILLTGLGLSSVLSARFVYPVPLPGQSPFATPSGSVGVNLLTQLIGFSALIVLVLPEVVLATIALVRGSVALGVATLGVGLVLGGALLAGGLLLGARWYDRRSPELLQQVTAMA